ncbi:MAG: translation initiation factor IF-2 [Clostridiales bacterium]|nr:translation initiation factor IF-2 [Clostridiales bacterium]
MMVKYRVHEVAKDFDLPTKTIADILAMYLTAPKNHMQVLTEQELNVIFDSLTLKNQVEDIQEIFAASKPPEVIPAEVEMPSEKKEQVEVQQEQKTIPVENKPTTAEPIQKQSITQPQTTITGESRPFTKKGADVRYVDTRTVAVDLSKYDDKVDALVPDSANKFNQGKQKIAKKRTNDKRPFISNKKHQEELEKMKRLQLEIAKKAQLKVSIPDEINVGELAMRLKKTSADVIKQLMKLGVMASISQMIDYETAALVALEFGAKVEKEVTVTIEERLIDDSSDLDENLELRDPVVVVMGHVDHGKTSLLDTIRNTNVVSGEAGGITQHIGAYRVKINGRDITFLDTPGHEAFTSMRARGAQATDIAILVVAADDGIMPQTIEAINHAKAANVPIIVAVNKMDKEGANPDRVMQQLTEHELVPEEWGGETIVCKVSAKNRVGIENLLEMILLTAEMRELKANPNRAAKGIVIEAKLDRGRGPVATVLVQNGTLKLGDVIIAGKTVGHVRAMTNDKGNKIESAGPSVPVEIIGLSEVPAAGDLFHAVTDERMARELVEERKAQEKVEKNSQTEKITLENLFDHIQQGDVKDLNIIVKADVQGSAEAVKSSLEKLSNEEVRVRVIHSTVGAVNESDVMLAAASGAIIVGFNVRPDPLALESATMQSVDIRLYRIIYDCIQEMESAMKGMLAPKYKEAVLGHAEIRQTFKVSGVGTIAGCYVTDGKIVRASSVRIVRNGIVVHEGELASLKRFKDDAKEVASGYECGLSIERFNDIKEGDVVEAYTMEEIPR